MLTKTKFKPIAVLACMVLVMLALFCIGNTEVSAETYSGTCGSGVNWSLDTDTGVLEITGSGRMADFTATSQPWNDYKTQITSVTLANGVNSIGSYAFYNCTALRDVYNHAVEPQSITMIFNTPQVTVHVPAQSLDAYKKDFNWREYNLVGDL